MSDIISQWISENLSAHTTLVIIFIAALIFLVWWARGIKESMKKVDSLPCDGHNEMMKKLVESNHNISLDITKRFAEMQTSIQFMQKNIDWMTQMQAKDHSGQHAFVKTQSPLSITTEGYELVNRLGVDKMLDANWSRISLFLDENVGSKNPYDIQQFCIQQAVVCPEKFLTNDELDVLKTEAFNKGQPLIIYLHVLAILARDRYFEEHGMNTSEIDKHDPNFQPTVSS